eukprot:gene4344-6147_t
MVHPFSPEEKDIEKEKKYFYIYEWPDEMDDPWPPLGGKLIPKSGYRHEFRGNNGAGSILNADVGLYNTWQFSLYRNMMARLRVSEYRTRDPEKATSFILPYDIGIHSYIDFTGKARLPTPYSWAGHFFLNNASKDKKLWWKNRGHDHFVLFSIIAYQTIGTAAKIFFMQICQNCTTITIETTPTKTATKGRSRKYWYAAPYPSSFHWHEGIKELPWAINDKNPPRDILALFVGSVKTIQPASSYLRKLLHTQCEFDSQCQWHGTNHSCSGCCRRDADFETRQKRQMEYFHIPPNEFKPVIIFVDCHIPRNMISTLISILEKYKFKVCQTAQNDPLLFTEIQNFVDNQIHPILLISKHEIQTGRTTFVNQFSHLLQSILPIPRVVGIDFFNDLRFEDWSSLFAPLHHYIESEMKNSKISHVNQLKKSENNISDNISLHSSSLQIGKIRKLSKLFKKMLIDERRKLINPSLSRLSNKDNSSCHIPVWLMASFQKDFQSFLTNISHFIQNKTKLSSLNSKNISISIYADLVLAATFSFMTGFWTDVDLSDWSLHHLLTGAERFMQACQTLSNNQLCDLINISSISTLKCDLFLKSKLEKAKLLDRAWSYLACLDLYNSPARYVFYKWIQEMFILLETLCLSGGWANSSSYDSLKVDFVRNMNWNNDICCKDPLTELVGELLFECFKPQLVYEEPNCPMKYYFDRQNFESIDEQSIGTALMTQHVCVYQLNDLAIVGVKINNNGRNEEDSVSLRLPKLGWKFFNIIETKEIIRMAQPNNTEIFEGKVKKYDLKSGKYTWFQLLSRWVCLDNIGEKFGIELIRARHLILSKLGVINGYLIRQEIFEERFGEVRILLYGLKSKINAFSLIEDIPSKEGGNYNNKGGAVTFMVDRNVIFQLIQVCDLYEEKDKLEALDAQSIAYIFSDRLKITPSKCWKSFLHYNDLLPRKKSYDLTVKLRRKQGPGRLVGRKLIIISNIELLLTIYELDNDTNSQALRIVLYEFCSCQTVEYRLSSMERLVLFRDDISIVEQIQKRIRSVYCEYYNPKNGTNIPKRQMIIIKNEKFQTSFEPFEIAGDQEYDILPISTSFNHHLNADKLDDGSLLEDGSLSTDAKYNFENHDKLLTGDENDSLSQQQFPITEKNDANSTSSVWGWSIYFNRAVLDEFIGNLVVSAGLSTVLGGFTITVFDQRTYYEAYRFISYSQSCKLLEDKTNTVLEKQLSQLDESVAFDLLDELMELLSLHVDDYGNLSLVLASDEDFDDLSNADLQNMSRNVNRIALANLKPHIYYQETVSKKRRAIIPQQININIHQAKELASVGIFGIRNPICIVKWNKREIGRTKPSKSTLDPIWKNCSYTAVTSKDQLLPDCQLEIELYDTDAKEQQQDFLGGIRLTGEELSKFLVSLTQSNANLKKKKTENTAESPTVGNETWFELQKSRKLGDIENQFVKGFICVSGTTQTQDNKSSNLLKKLENKLSKINDSKDNDPFLQSNSNDYHKNDKINVNKSSSSFQNGKSSSVSFDLYIENDKNSINKGNDLTNIPQNGVIETITLLKSIPFSLTILSALNLPNDLKSSQVTCIIRFNHIEVMRYYGTVMKDKKNQNYSSFYDSDIILYPPAGYPIGGCHLEILICHSSSIDHEKFHLFGNNNNQINKDINNMDEQVLQHYQIDDIYGILTVCGSELHELAHNSSADSIEKSIMMEMKESNVLSHNDGVNNYINNKIHHNKSILELFISTNIQFEKREFEVSILGAIGLGKADMFGSSDPFVRVTFDGHIIGQTEHCKNTVNPIWKEEKQNHKFKLKLSRGKYITRSLLEIEVFDYDYSSSHDFLGMIRFDGEDLKNLLERSFNNQTIRKYNNEVQSTAKKSSRKSIVDKMGLEGMTSYPLLKSEKYSKKENNLVQGELFFSIHSIKNKENNNDVIMDDLEEESKGLHVLEKIQNAIPQQIILHIFSAKNLHKADLFGKRMLQVVVSLIWPIISLDMADQSILLAIDPFVNIIFNGNVIGCTKCIHNTLNPDWGNDEAFVITIPSGIPLQNCRLELEVFDRDLLKTGNFLGVHVMEGNELSDMLNQTRDLIEKNSSDFFPLLRGQFYKLFPSIKYNQKTISGDIEITIIEDNFYNNNKNNNNNGNTNNLMKAIENTHHYSAKDLKYNDSQALELYLLSVIDASSLISTIHNYDDIISNYDSNGNGAYHRNDDIDHTKIEMIVKWNNQEIKRIYYEYNKQLKSLLLLKENNIIQTNNNNNNNSSIISDGKARRLSLNPLIPKSHFINIVMKKKRDFSHKNNREIILGKAEIGGYIISTTSATTSTIIKGKSSDKLNYIHSDLNENDFNWKYFFESNDKQ